MMTSTHRAPPATIVGWKGIAVTKQGKRKRPWWSYASLSVRASIVLIVVIAAALAWVSLPASVQRNAVRGIEESGGKVWYDSQADATPIARVRTRPLPTEKQTWTGRLADFTSAASEWIVDSFPHWPPRWLVDSLGPDYFSNVVSVSFTHRATDAELIQVGNLKRLERLDLYGSLVTDRGLARLKGLPHLHTLLLVRTKVGDAGLAQLAGMKSLRILSLEGTELSDEGVSHLRGLTNLEDLDLANTMVCDAGLAHLKGLSKLQALDLSRTGVTDAGLGYLEGLIGLQELSLGRTKITDAGLKHLTGLANLMELTLDRTTVSDAGLLQIEGLNQLATLSLEHTKVSDAAVSQLQLHRAQILAKQTPALPIGAQSARQTISKLEIMR
jgi:hypothetical protein